MVDCFFDMQKTCPINWFTWYKINVRIFQLSICSYFLSFLKSSFCYVDYFKVLFDSDIRLSNSSTWNDNEIMFKWNKENGLPIRLKVAIKLLIVKWLVTTLSSQLTALMKYSVLEFAASAISVNLACFLVTVCLSS